MKLAIHLQRHRGHGFFPYTVRQFPSNLSRVSIYISLDVEFQMFYPVELPRPGYVTGLETFIQPENIIYIEQAYCKHVEDYLLFQLIILKTSYRLS